MYDLLVHIQTTWDTRSYAVGSFVLLCNPWLKDDPVYMPLEVQLQEYVKSDFGLVYTGTHVNISKRPWSFGQYEPGVLEACLKLLQVSPQHLKDKHRDYVRRADPIYLSRVICAMVNCNDDLGLLEGRWDGSYRGGVSPTEWSSSADILHRWASSNCSPVRYGQCWVFASVLCTVMRVLGIPSRVVTVFNAAHDTNGNLKIEEIYSTRGQKCEKLGLSKDSIWNFHVWVECWMRRPDLGPEFDGWQVVDPTPQEKSAGVYCCGPCPVVAIQRGCLNVPYDTSFIYASVDADVVRMIVRDGLVVDRTVDTQWVGQLIYTKSIESDRPENLTRAYKSHQKGRAAVAANAHVMQKCRAQPLAMAACSPPDISSTMLGSETGRSHTLEVSLQIERVPSVGESICVCVTVKNRASRHRVLVEHVSAQLKQYCCSPQEPFWAAHKELHIQAGQVLTLHHAISASEYECVLAGEDIVNIGVVMKDVRTKERVLSTAEFNITAPQITIEVLGGDSIQMRKESTVQVSFTNTFSKVLSGAVLTVEGSGLLQGKQQSRLVLLQPGQTIQKTVSIMATSPGTKLLMASLSHSHSPSAITRSFHRVSVVTS
ncbi:protein-glutamine gamma-glutamyltransferase 5-like [Myripristis murdjan]|uniref:protein-glutamine gamma-glutamyltransferase 5-like n=1 Tax=Myripristis murdjan TaxID=586833 RepID=UPI00117634B6|nr:protein-glutamine gamma-glutamyltransferase 2 [Myripristis murdjan]